MQGAIMFDAGVIPVTVVMPSGGSMQRQAVPDLIVSGGGVDVMRPWTERTDGNPPEQVIGFSIESSS